MVVKNDTLQRAVQSSAECGNKLVNFDDVIWPHEVSDIARELNEMHTKEFTISVCATNLIEILSLFEKEGFKVRGTISVKKLYDANKEIPALLLKATGKKN